MVSSDGYHQFSSDKEKRIIVVGPNEPEQRDIEFLNQLKSILHIPFNYVAFNHYNLEAIEY